MTMDYECALEASLQRLHDEEQEREQRLNRIFERLKTLMHRFAGEPDA